MLLSVSLMLLGVLGGFNAVQDWDFADAGIMGVWHANSFLADVKVEDGALHARTIDWDPFFTCVSLEIPATASQCVLIRIKASKPGSGQLFWTGQTDGKYEGFSEKKLTNFTVSDSKAFQDIYLFPSWQSEKVIRKLRLDLYDETEFSIQRVAILDHDNAQPVTSPQVWEFNAEHKNEDWVSLNNGMLLSRGQHLSVNTTGCGVDILSTGSQEGRDGIGGMEHGHHGGQPGGNGLCRTA